MCSTFKIWLEKFIGIFFFTCFTCENRLKNFVKISRCAFQLLALFFILALCPLCKFKHSWRRDFLRKWWWPPIECNEVISDQSFAAYVHKPWDLHGTQGYFIFLLIEIAHKQREIVFVTVNVLLYCKNYTWVVGQV